MVEGCDGGRLLFSLRLFGGCSGSLTASGPGLISLLRILGLIFVIIKNQFSELKLISYER